MYAVHLSNFFQYIFDTSGHWTPAVFAGGNQHLPIRQALAEKYEFKPQAALPGRLQPCFRKL